MIEFSKTSDSLSLVLIVISGCSKNKYLFPSISFVLSFFISTLCFFANPKPVFVGTSLSKHILSGGPFINFFSRIIFSGILFTTNTNLMFV